MPTIVRSANTATVIRVSSARTAASADTGQRHVASPDRAATVVNDGGQRTVNVAAPGPQGAAGTPGTNGAGLIPPIPFAWGDASPRVVHTVAEDSYVDLVQLLIETPFNGIDPAITVGITGQPALLMPATYSDPLGVGTFEASPDQLLPAGTQITLSVSPGAGGAAGAGQLFLSLIPTA